MLRRYVFIAASAATLFTLSYCNRPRAVVSPYKNLSDTAHFVGMEQCRACHANVYNTFIETGMGKSWDHASPQKSSAKFDDHSYVYDRFKNFWYHPFWKNDSLYLREFRLEGSDTVYSRIEKISYIVGSGQHTNSHLWELNGFLYQAPLTFYTQAGIWDLPPGFEDGMNTRWSRIVSLECMNCHNMYPQFEKSSENKFLSVKSGIECERCHGPGSIHVQEKLAGILVDTTREIDYSIVNPAHLSRELQVELCQRCHLQGISVLNQGKTFFDFKPGMRLNEVMNVFMPRYEGNPDRFIMASHADRMKQSRCYQQSQMSCLSCHNPHVSVKATPAEKFNAACISCHRSAEGKNGMAECTLPAAERKKENDHCYKCHMPVSETIDIPHVTVHDHRIRIPVTEKEKTEILKFINLECLTSDEPSPLLMAHGYLQTYEAFSPQNFLLDSADYYLKQVKKKDEEATAAVIRLHFLKNDFQKVIAEAGAFGKKQNVDAWTWYRIGEAYYQTGNFERAKENFLHAVKQQKFNLEFQNKLGSCYLALNQVDSARAVFRFCLSENPAFSPAHNNYGYLLLLKGETAQADSFFNRALALDPDYETALMNKAALLLATKREPEAIGILQRVLRLNPDNAGAQQALKNRLP
jgi:predicted CXXCH cytochrome family protein